MTTTTTQSGRREDLSYVPHPAGAASVNDWYLENDGQWYRVFTHAVHEMGEGDLCIRGTQCEDGKTYRGIYLVSNDDDLTPRQARKLAAMLQNFADTCQILDGTT